MRRTCDSCGTPLKQGFVEGRKLLCGRSKVQKSVPSSDGFKLVLVSTGGCVK